MFLFVSVFVRVFVRVLAMVVVTTSEVLGCEIAVPDKDPAA